MDQFEFIRVANRVYGKGIREIAREFKHSRKTVRKALGGNEPGYRMKKRRACPVMDPVRDRVQGWLEADMEKPRKQRHTAKRIYDRLVEECGFKGSESTVRHFVRRCKQTLGLGRSKAMLPLVQVPGEAEVDWGEAQVKLGGVLRRVHLFCMRARYSGKAFVRAYLKESQEMFLDGHVHAFGFFGGVFPTIVYDNLKAAVGKILLGGTRQEQRAFQRCRAHYTFASRYCNVASGHEKGGVEGLVGYARRNLLVPIPEVDDLEVLNALLAEGCQRLAERVLGGRECARPIAEWFAEERAALLPLPSHPHQVCQLRTSRVDKYQTVRVESVRYSVPERFVGRQVEVQVTPDEVGVACDGQAIARHGRCLERDRWVLNPDHYLDQLKRKPGAFDRARPLRDWRASWPPSHERLLEGLQKRKGPREGSREFVDVLGLYRSYSQQEVEAVIDLAVEEHIYDGAAISCLIRDLSGSCKMPQPLPNRMLPASCQVAHSRPDCGKYDALVVHHEAR